MTTLKFFVIGENNHGELGLGHSNPVKQLTALNNKSITKVITCPDYIILTNDDYAKLWATGFNYDGH